jgi:hypothetical protein
VSTPKGSWNDKWTPMRIANAGLAFVVLGCLLIVVGMLNDQVGRWAVVPGLTLVLYGTAVIVFALTRKIGGRHNNSVDGENGDSMRP